MTGLPPPDNSTAQVPCLAPQAQVAVVLVEPQIPQNAGNIARLCACTGCDLFLVGSLGFRWNNTVVKRAGMDYLDQANVQHVADFNDVLAQKPGWSPYFATSKATQSYTQITYPPNTLLVFGSETYGLPEAFLAQHAHAAIRIPMVANTRSLNLANAAAIVLYEVIRQYTP
jgi:tRNA (cytidine/uridine-2'-O-)-methyltransferase